MLLNRWIHTVKLTRRAISDTQCIELNPMITAITVKINKSNNLQTYINISVLYWARRGVTSNAPACRCTTCRRTCHTWTCRWACPSWPTSGGRRWPPWWDALAAPSSLYSPSPAARVTTSSEPPKHTHTTTHTYMKNFVYCIMPQRQKEHFYYRWPCWTTNLQLLGNATLVCHKR